MIKLINGEEGRRDDDASSRSTLFYFTEIMSFMLAFIRLLMGL